jgi:hypothetical protein
MMRASDFSAIAESVHIRVMHISYHNHMLNIKQQGKEKTPFNVSLGDNELELY